LTARGSGSYVVHPVRALLLLTVTACVQKAPQANVIINENRAPTSHAVLVMPTTCFSYADVTLCHPDVWMSHGDLRAPPQSFGEVIDPALRLKLEFAGFTLAEAGALRLVMADRKDVNGKSEVIETTDGPVNVAQLSFDDARAVAASLALTSVLTSHIMFRPAGPGEVSGELVVQLLDVATNQPRWTVSCKETMYDVIQSSNRLANCAGNGVLAVLAPGNLIGRAL